jgi:hypothetical protein
VGNEDDGALIVVERVEERTAALDIEMVGRLIEDKQMRRRHRHEIEQQPRALAAGQVCDRGFLLVEREARTAPAAIA